MLEYASMRFMLVCTSAAKLPTTMLTTATTPMAICQVWTRSINGAAKMRRNATKAAALVAVAMNAVIGVGAPS